MKKITAIAGVALVIGIFVTTVTIQSVDAAIVAVDEATIIRSPKAPAVVSGDNIYIAWWTNNTENRNEEVMFRASNDGGATFGDKINLSNSSNADSWRVEIHGEGENVAVSWWETNQTSDVPVARISTDGGETFGPLVMLAANGTLVSGEAEEIDLVVEGGEGE